MESAGSAIITTLGAGSGVDFITLASDLADATYSVQRTNIETRNEALEAQISAASLLRSSLTGLASALGDRVRNGDLAPRAEIDNPGLVSVSTTPGLTPTGTYSLEVSQLARGQMVVSDAYGSADDLVGAGTLRFRFGEVTETSFTRDTTQPNLDIAVEATDTLSSLAGKITAQSEGKLEAYVSTGTDGAQLVVKSKDGAQSGFVMRVPGGSGASEPGNLKYLAWRPQDDTGQLRQTSRDALFSLDTVAMSSASNLVTGLPEGMSFDLKATNAGAPTTVSFSNDLDAVSDVMSDFVAALNDLAGLLNEEASALGGTLGNDPGARELKRDLQRLTSEIVMPNAAAGEPATLSDLGLKTNRDGTFALDGERLAATLEASPDAVAAMFTTGAFGVFATVDNLARANSLSSDPGSLGGSLTRFEDRIERNDERLSKIAEQQESLRARLTRELVAAERRIANSQSTLGFLQQQIEAWNTSN
ncbi:flagellar filament capping protein FliD [Qipengyuania nanhaisediminis]|uniref:flagellar filament capping protein FliD n=1 Tax=Qipengyuania nanhaisediminis TaxID=604088 RepID=UPI0038B255F8